MTTGTIQKEWLPFTSTETAPISWLFRMLAKGHRERFFWSLQLAFWGAIGLIIFLLSSIFQPSTQTTGWLILTRVLTGFLMSAGLREIYRRPVVRRQNPWKKAALIVSCCLVLAMLEGPLTLLLQRLHLSAPDYSPYYQNHHPAALRLISLLIWSSLYAVFHQLEGAHALELRALQAEVMARNNELRHLQAQLNPHFLFNALNAVLASKEDPDAVEEVTQSLADFLRFSLRETSSLEPLARELDALETYLTVQRIRFGDKLVCQIQSDTAARSVLVPPMMLQPLLENAFNYGGETSPLPLQVKLSARVEGSFLDVTVANTGQWIQSPQTRSTGIGIRNLQQRLNLLIGEQATIHHEAADGWVRVAIRIPLTANNPANA